MKSSKLINNISDKLKAEIPKLKPGEVVVFQMLHGVPNAEPDERERSKNPILYGKVQVQTQQRIYDPYQVDSTGKEVGGYVDIGVVDAWVGDKPEKFRCFVPGQGAFSQFQGKFQLQGGSIQDEELYEILWLSNERADNKHRDKSVEPLFKIVNTKTESTATLNKIDQLRKVLKITENISEQDALEVMASLNQPTYTDKDVLIAKVSQLAKDDPDMFLKTYNNEDRALKATLKFALEQRVLVHNSTTGNVTMGNTIVTVAKVKPDEIVNHLVQFVKTAANGKDVLGNIKTQLESKKEVLEA